MWQIEKFFLNLNLQEAVGHLCWPVYPGLGSRCNIRLELHPGSKAFSVRNKFYRSFAENLMAIPFLQCKRPSRQCCHIQRCLRPVEFSSSPWSLRWTLGGWCVVRLGRLSMGLNVCGSIWSSIGKSVKKSLSQTKYWQIFMFLQIFLIIFFVLCNKKGEQAYFRALSARSSPLSSSSTSQEERERLLKGDEEDPPTVQSTYGAIQA